MVFSQVHNLGTFSLLNIETCLHETSPCVEKIAVFLLSQSDNHLAIQLSAKMVDIEIVWPTARRAP
jgi:hypothetical protein